MMTRSLRSLFAALALVSLAACGDDDDDTVTPDAMLLGVDASIADADVLAPDAAFDATPADPVDASPPDATPPSPDAMPASSCAATFANCNTYTDLTAQTNVAITTSGNAYDKKCIKVKVGTTITIAASGTHPFASAACNAAPIAANSTSAVTFTPSATGTYGYFCTNHGSTTGANMAGAIQVVP